MAHACGRVLLGISAFMLPCVVHACSSSGPELTDRPLLNVRTAHEALCGGGAQKQGDGGPSAGHGGSSTSMDASAASGGSAGSSYPSYGGSGGGQGQGGSSGAWDAAGDSIVDPAPDAPDSVEAGSPCGPEADAEADAEAGACPGPEGTQTEAGSPPMHFAGEVPTGCQGVDLATPLKLYLSSDDSNSMASPVIVRSLINAYSPDVDPAIVRTWEFLNYYRFNFTPAPPGSLSILSQIGSCELTGDIALQIAVQSEAAGPRRPLNLTFVLDTSGSMGGSPILLERAAVRAMAHALQAGDIVNAVTWSDTQAPVLQAHLVSGPDDLVLLDMADNLSASGSTNLHAGLMLGYQLAEQVRGTGRINRVMLISDGQANTGITDVDLIAAKAEDKDEEGIYLIGVGVGAGINDTLMDGVTDAGRGAYIYLDSESEANRMFVDRFAESVLVAARGVRVEITLPAYFNIKKFYGEGYSPDPAKIKPQHLAPNDSMVFFQILHPCDRTMARATDPYRVRVTWSDPLSGEQKEAVQNTTLGGLDIDDGNLSKATVVVSWAELLKELRGMPKPQRIVALKALRQHAEQVGLDQDLSEIHALAGSLIDLNGEP